MVGKTLSLTFLGIWAGWMGLAQEPPAKSGLARHQEHGCVLKTKPNGPDNFEYYFKQGYKAFGIREWEDSLPLMENARRLCPEETGRVKFKSRERVTYVPTLYIWAATYHCDRGDPARLIQLFRDIFRRWDLSCVDEARGFLDDERRLLTSGNRPLDAQIENFELSLRTISPQSARELCRRFLEILEQSASGQTALDDERVWAQLAQEQGYAWPPEGWEESGSFAKTGSPEGLSALGAEGKEPH